MMIESGTSQCPRLYNVILAGPNTEKFVKIQQAMQVGGPQHREIGTQFQQAMQVGDNEINFIKISFLSHPYA